MRIRRWALGWLIVCGACANGIAPPATPPPAPNAASTLGVGDVVEVRIYREKDLDGSYRVGADGFIDFPLIGRVQLAQKHPKEVEQEIRARLADGFLVDPHVAVFVRERNSQKVHVLGEVNKPGTFPFEDGMSIVQAITNAGGFRDTAWKNRVTVTRTTTEGKTSTFQVPVGDIGSGKANNFVLSPGDIVSVPQAIF